MKRILLVVAALFLMTATANAATIMLEDFEDAAVSYTTQVPEFTDGSGDFFTRTDGSNIGSYVSYNNIQGSGYFAVMDTNGDGGPTPVTMTFSNIDINGYSNLAFSGLFAEDDASDGKEDWDRVDYVTIEYRIDNGSYQNLLAFENDGETYNTQAYQDTDFDGNGDGAALTDTFALFGADIAGTGSSLDLQLTFRLEAGDEDIALDNLMVTGTAAPVPVPSAFILLGAGVVAVCGLRRRNS